MPPIHEYENWSLRASDIQEPIDPKKKYIFICEGTNTEVHYVKALMENRDALGLDPLIDIRLWERTEEDFGITNPLRLVQFAQHEKEDPHNEFDKELDKMVIVIDLDIYCRVGTERKGRENGQREYKQMIAATTDEDILAVTNPSFELFLLLHKENAYEEIIAPHATELLENRKEGKHRYARKLFGEEYGMNPKSNPAIGQLAKFVDIATQEERNLNQDLDHALEMLTSNVAAIIDMIRKDRFEP